MGIVEPWLWLGNGGGGGRVVFLMGLWLGNTCDGDQVVFLMDLWLVCSWFVAGYLLGFMVGLKVHDSWWLLRGGVVESVTKISEEW